MRFKCSLMVMFVITVAIVGVVALSQSDRTLTIAIERSIGNMDPMGNAVITSIGTLRNIYDGFFERTPEGELIPGLVESYEQLDQLTWRFHVRQGISFHNGNPLTAEDLKFTLERTSNYERSQYVEVGSAIDSVTVLDPYTLDIVTSSPNPIFPSSIYSLGVMDKEWTESNDSAYISTHAMGTGPYKFVEWVAEDHLTLEGNENYWGGAPAIKKVVYRPISDETTRVAALESGDVDLITALPVESIERVERSAHLDLVVQRGHRFMMLGLEHSEGFPTADYKVRKAMYMAINIDEIIEEIWNGYAEPCTQLVAGPAEAYPGYDADLSRLFPYDPEESMRLLEEAGYPDGFEITLDGVFDSYPKDEQVCLAVATYLQQVGIRCLLNVRSKAIHFGEIQNAETHFWFGSWREQSFDLAEAFFAHIMTRQPGRSQGGWNAGWYSNPEVDMLVEEANGSLSPEERASLLRQANRLAMEDIAVIPLYLQPDIWGMSANLLNLTPRADMFMLADEMSYK
jgi:peptide/nickel transport system substrate-binding protein